MNPLNEFFFFALENLEKKQIRRHLVFFKVFIFFFSFRKRRKLMLVIFVSVNQDDLEPLRKRQKNYKRPTVQILDDAKIAIKRKEGEKATDDYHYERFKKQFRRY